MAYSQYAVVRIVGESDLKRQFVKRYLGQAIHEVDFCEFASARKFPLGTASSVADYIRQAVEVGRPVPRMWRTAQAQYQHGTPLPGEPQLAQYAPTKPAPAPLPEVPEVVQLADGSWRKVPEMQLKSGGYVVPYAFMERGEPRSGYFKARTRRDLFDAIFDISNDAILDGEGQYIDRNTKIPKQPTLEQIYRLTLPTADPAAVQKYLALIAERDAAHNFAEAELNRTPTEQEIQAASVTRAEIDIMPSAVLKDKMLSDRAFNSAYERLLAAELKFQQKEQAEIEEQNRQRAAKEARERLAKRERGKL